MPKISDRSDIENRWFWAGFATAPCVAVSVCRAVQSVQLTPAGGAAAGRRSGNNTCGFCIESSFSACLKVVFFFYRTGVHP